MKETETIGLPEDKPPHGASASFCLIMIYGEHLGRRFPIADKPLVVGRAPECDIRVEDESVSRRHCRIFPGGNAVTIQDLGSRNRTYVNGEAATSRVLADQDQIRIGRGIFKFLSGDNVENAYHEELYRLSTLDGLTGAFNRSHFEKELQREFERFLRYRRPLSLFLIDIDHFKSINDKFGHLAGDRVLAQLVSVIAGHIRVQDTLSRYGGEEFAVLMPEIEFQDAVRIAGRICGLVVQSQFEFDGQDIPVTVSIGVSEAETSNIIDPTDLIRIADANLYEAKHAGRNCVKPDPSDL